MASYEVVGLYWTLLSDMGKYALKDGERREKQNQKHHNQTNLHFI